MKRQRSASTVRVAGDDLQHLVAWVELLNSRLRESDVAGVHVEDRDPGSVDDSATSLTGSSQSPPRRYAPWCSNGRQPQPSFSALTQAAPMFAQTAQWGRSRGVTQSSDRSANKPYRSGNHGSARSALRHRQPGAAHPGPTGADHVVIDAHLSVDGRFLCAPSSRSARSQESTT
jgi:hypothetical protein